jgi:hypothetical protein
MIMVVTIKQLKIVFLLCLFSPALSWAKLDYAFMYNEVLNNRAVLIDARQGVQSGELSVTTFDSIVNVPVGVPPTKQS